MNKQRLDKIISTQFNISRKDARRDIKIGKVTVDGKTVKDFGFQADPEAALIEYMGQALCYKEHLYLVMNKPRGVISASLDKSRETVVDLVPEPLRRQGLFPVGRLDRDTTGLLIITDDGDFAHSLLSPKKEIFKTYEAELDGKVTEEMCKIFADGITLADGTLCRKAELKPMGECKAEIKICEGRYHQIKRMFGVVNLGVNELKRVAVGGFFLPENLKSGECRELTNSEINAIFTDC
ncbi:MAG: pseudouridine synthase [Acutalibacteraceae bacterium]|nr:pseudouridine synthase [Acutalibacteraceae bacterium]